MRQRTLIVLVAATVFVGVALATLPASLLTSRLPPTITAAGVGGTIWSGGADALRINGVPMGELSWSADPLGLLHGALVFNIELARADGYVRGRLAAHPGGALTADGVELKLGLAALSGDLGPYGWQGDLSGTVRAARIENGWPVALDASFTVSNVKPQGAQITIGSYAIDFDPATPNATQLVGRIHDIAAPLIVRAQLTIDRARTYVVSGDLTPRADAPSEVTQAVAFLGAPDSAGRRQFQLTGVF